MIIVGGITAPAPRPPGAEPPRRAAPTDADDPMLSKPGIAASEPDAAVPLPRAAGLPDTIDLRELRYFAAAARSGNLARAAQHLNVTASAISQQLRKLETELGTPLLARHARGVTATQAGCRLLDRVDAVERLLRVPLGPDDPRAAPAGTLTLALPSELAGVLATPVCTVLRERLPEVTPVVKESVDGGLDSWLLSGLVDLAVLPDAADLDELRCEPLLSEAVGLVTSPRSPLAEQAQPRRLHELDRLRLILPGKRHWLRRRLARVAFQRGVRCEPTFEVDSLAITKELVRQDLGHAVLPRAAVREEAARGALIFQPLVHPALDVTYAIALAGAPAPMVTAAAAAVRDAIIALTSDGGWPGARPYRPPADLPPGLPAAGNAAAAARRLRQQAVHHATALRAGR